jgi:protein-tyrosine phosphatase
LYEIESGTPGRLATMAHPRGFDLIDSEMERLREADVDVVVSLQPTDEQAYVGLTGEAEAARRAGLAFRHLPIADMGIPDDNAAADIVSEIVADLRSGRFVAVHCHAGIGRSSTIAAAVLIRLGVTPADACTTISAARGMRVPETQRQRNWLDRWAELATRDGHRTDGAHDA